LTELDPTRMLVGDFSGVHAEDRDAGGHLLRPSQP
jgi:hypothetical protein